MREHPLMIVSCVLTLLPAAGTAVAAESPTTPKVAAAGPVTRPSGVDPATRSRECNQEADRRGLASNARQAFQVKCLATAGPPAATGTSTKNPTPTPANNSLGQLPR